MVVLESKLCGSVSQDTSYPFSFLFLPYKLRCVLASFTNLLHSFPSFITLLQSLIANILKSFSTSSVHVNLDLPFQGFQFISIFAISFSFFLCTCPYHRILFAVQILTTTISSPFRVSSISMFIKGFTPSFFL